MSTATSPQQLTSRQREVLEWISTFLAEQGYSPSVREISQAFGFNVHAATQHRDVLRRKGCLTYTPGQARSICISGGHHANSTAE